MKLSAMGAGILLGSTALAAPALAQDLQSEVDQAATSDDDNVIIVTATRRAADVQDIPIAVTAVTPVQLEQQGIANIQTLGAVAPSFSIQAGNTESQGSTIRIRGVGTTGANIGLESAVGVFIDGVYQSRPGVALGELVDVEQIEVLRGPQGTLFGRNTTAGALVVRNKRPNLTDFEGFALASYGNYDFINLQGAISAPLVSDQLGIRLSGAFRKHDGFAENPTNGTESYNRDRYMIRGQLLWEPSPDVSLRLVADYQKTDENCCDTVSLRAGPGAPPASVALLFPNGTQGPDGLRSSEFPFPIDQIVNSDGFENDVEQWGVSGELVWDFGGAELTLIGSYRDFLGEFRQDDFNGALIYSVSGVTFPAGTPPSFDEIKTWTAEGRLQGEAFDGVLDWLVGVYYSDEQIQEDFAVRLGSDFSGVVGPALGLGLPGFAFQGIADAGSIFSNGVLDVTDPGFAQGTFAPNPIQDQSATNRFLQDGTSFSVFTHNIFNITDEFSVTLGARYVDDNKDASFTQIGSTGNACLASRTYLGGLSAALTAAGGGDPSGLAAIDAALTPIYGAAGAGALQVPAIAGFGAFANCFVFAAPVDPFAGANPLFAGLPVEFADSFSDDELIYTIQAAWEPNDDLLLYGGFTHGYKAGGFNLDSTGAIGGGDPRFRSEEIDAYELGIKSTLLNGRARANVALFYSDLTDFQVLEFDGTRFRTFNVGDVSSKGVELELFAQWSDYISNSFAVTYTDASYGSNCDLGGTIPQATALCGSQLTNAPRWVGITGMTYDGPINSSDWSMLANVNIRYESDRRTSTNPQDGAGLVPFDIQDSHFKVNARLGFTTPDDRFTVEVWGRNLTNEITRSLTVNTPPFVGLTSQGTQARGAIIEEPRTYGVTFRGRF